MSNSGVSSRFAGELGLDPGQAPGMGGEAEGEVMVGGGIDGDQFRETDGAQQAPRDP